MSLALASLALSAARSRALNSSSFRISTTRSPHCKWTCASCILNVSRSNCGSNIRPSPSITASAPYLSATNRTASNRSTWSEFAGLSSNCSFFFHSVSG